MIRVVCSRVDGDGCPVDVIDVVVEVDDHDEATDALRYLYNKFPNNNFDLVDADTGRWLSWVL